MSDRLLGPGAAGLGGTGEVPYRFRPAATLFNGTTSELRIATGISTAPVTGNQGLVSIWVQANTNDFARTDQRHPFSMSAFTAIQVGCEAKLGDNIATAHNFTVELDSPASSVNWYDKKFHHLLFAWDRLGLGSSSDTMRFQVDGGAIQTSTATLSSFNMWTIGQ
jgi:hypothetical protein